MNMKRSRGTDLAEAALSAIGINRVDVLHICGAYGAQEVAVFGSVIRGEATPESDLDLLVTFAKGTSLFDWVALEEELAERLKRKVDVVSRNGLSRHIGPAILKEAVLL